ncbi:hypothetical protein QCE62_07055 [Caballeronia sp. LZ033]|uniref:hypothetical protein n=1 Tax=Caballeronia sp. LZ033 TaxID=3038566 RepID=UPI00285FC71D|nr:hypothetical protein [Caballeronia sp. LZ033]MDR5813350.1 hypothetical protein [Caballeronia sp. LZ033]
MIPFELPDYSADWWPIYLEPIPGSGERLTIAVITVGRDGQRQVRSTLPKAALTMLYGEHSTGMMAVVVQTLERVQRQLDEHTDPKKITLPFGGVFLGQPRDALADDINGVFDQAIRLTSSLGVTAFGEANSRTSEVARVFAEWSLKVRESVLRKHATWDERFERNVKVSGKKSARISYMHHEYAANFGVIRPRQGADIRALKIKIFDLEQVRRQNPLTVRQVEVLVGVPNEATPGLTTRDARSISENFEYIYYEGRARDIVVRKFDSPREVAKHLVKQAA